MFIPSWGSPCRKRKNGGLSPLSISKPFTPKEEGLMSIVATPSQETLWCMLYFDQLLSLKLSIWPSLLNEQPMPLQLHPD